MTGRELERQRAARAAALGWLPGRVTLPPAHKDPRVKDAHSTKLALIITERA